MLGLLIFGMKFPLTKVWEQPCKEFPVLNVMEIRERCHAKYERCHSYCDRCHANVCLFVCVEVLRPSQPNGVMSSAVSLPNHTFTGQA